MSAADPPTLPEISRWPAVSVVIPARDCADTLPTAVASARAQRFDGSLEVVVAVAPSADDTAQVARDLAAEARIRIEPNPAGTTPAAMNAGIRAARGDVVVRLDAHAELPDGYIARALDILRETGAANVGGMQVPAAEDGFARAVALAMRSPLGSGGARYRVGGPPGDVDTVYLGVFHRDALGEVGGFDERLVRNQDYELNHRLRAAGYRVYFHPDLRVRYQPRTTPRGVWQQYWAYGAWKRHVVIRHPGSLRPRQAGPPLLVLALVLVAILGVTSDSWWPLGVLAGTYLALVLAGAVAASRSTPGPAAPGRSEARPEDPGSAAPGPGVADQTALGGIRYAPAVAAAVVLMHLAWGLGFLVGRRG